jgi:hypothetical protein
LIQTFPSLSSPFLLIPLSFPFLFLLPDLLAPGDYLLFPSSVPFSLLPLPSPFLPISLSSWELSPLPSSSLLFHSSLPFLFIFLFLFLFLVLVLVLSSSSYLPITKDVGHDEGPRADFNLVFVRDDLFGDVAAEENHFLVFWPDIGT